MSYSHNNINIIILATKAGYRGHILRRDDMNCVHLGARVFGLQDAYRAEAVDISAGNTPFMAVSVAAKARVC